jgi:hypothetical protein
MSTKVEDLAVTVRTEYRAAIKGPMDYLDHALKCGDALIAARKAVGKAKFSSFLKTQCKELRLENDRTLRNWMRWAEPENKTRIEENRKHVSKTGDEEGLTVRQINEIVKAPLSEARKASIEVKKMEREAAKKGAAQSFEERILNLDVPELIKVLEDLHGLDFLNSLSEELVKRKQANDPGIPAVLRRAEQELTRRI